MLPLSRNFSCEFSRQLVRKGRSTFIMRGGMYRESGLYVCVCVCGTKNVNVCRHLVRQETQPEMETEVELPA